MMGEKEDWSKRRRLEKAQEEHRPRGKREKREQQDETAWHSKASLDTIGKIGEADSPQPALSWTWQGVLQRCRSYDPGFLASGEACTRGDVQKLDPQFLSDLEDSLIAIEFAEANPRDSGVHEGLEAVPAGTRRHIDRRLVDVDAVAGGLENCVHLLVDRGDAVVVVHHVAYLGAVRHAANRAIVAGR